MLYRVMALECKLVGARRPNLQEEASMEVLVERIADLSTENGFSQNLHVRLKWRRLWFCIKLKTLIESAEKPLKLWAGKVFVLAPSMNSRNAYSCRLLKAVFSTTSHSGPDRSASSNAEGKSLAFGAFTVQ